MRRPSLRGVAQPGAGWAVLSLYVLAPAVGEMLSGSTPPLMFINPVSLFFLCGLYGSGALLAREAVRRRGLGWPNLLLLGAAYGVLEEGLVVTSWFNPYWPDVEYLGGYGRWLGTNWVWALGLTIYHAVVSITIPVLLVETSFPQRARTPWLRRGGLRLFGVLLTGVSLLMLLLLGFVAYRKHGYTHPPLGPYLLALTLAAGLVWLGLHIRVPASRRVEAPPGLWRLRLAGLGGTVAFFVCLWGLHSLIPVAAGTMLITTLLVALATRKVLPWAAHSRWGAEQRLALAAGAMGFFILLAPLIEFAVHPPGRITIGMSEVALIWLAGLVWLSRRAAYFTYSSQGNTGRSSRL